LSALGLDYQGSGGFGGGSGGGGGGGFGGGSQGTPSSTARKSYDEQCMLPCTVSMVLNSQQTGDDDAMVLADGRKVYHVKLVGAVRSVEDFSTNCVYGIEDGTGLMEVKQWLDGNDCLALTELRQSTQKENIYVKVIGQLKIYDDKKLLVADSIRPLKTGNEITHHFLEVVYDAEKSKRKSRIGGMAPMMMGGVGFGGMASARTPVQQQSAEGGDSGMKAALLQYVRNAGESSECGVNVMDVVQNYGGQYSEEQVRRCMEDLAAEGHIYSTIDEEHFKYAT
jgi:replication factor A2